MTPRVTTVVMTRDRWPDLERSLPHHTGPVILVDNGSCDGTPRRARERFPAVTVVALPDNAGAVARNIGVEAARTPYVAFADDDSWWAPHALERAAEHLDQHPRLALLAARIHVGEAAVLEPVCTLMARSPLPRDVDLPGPSVLGFIACGAVLRRDAFLEAGGFDPVVHFAGEEERLALDLAARGWGLAYVDDVVAHHRPSPARHDGDTRRAVITRNQLLTAVMRRPWPVVARSFATAFVAGGPERQGAVQSLSRLRPALAERTVLPTVVERRRRMLG